MDDTILIENMRHAAEECDNAGRSLEAKYLRDGADRIAALTAGAEKVEMSDPSRVCITCGKLGGSCRWVDDSQTCMQNQLTALRTEIAALRQPPSADRIDAAMTRLDQHAIGLGRIREMVASMLAAAEQVAPRLASQCASTRMAVGGASAQEMWRSQCLPNARGFMPAPASPTPPPQTRTIRRGSRGHSRNAMLNWP